ncbi:protein CFAP20DC isoform X2 [Halichoeres trimaculatus]|uniref:protein CFAP20DC isoform X2 n=1 Tax=Halichoeres trimaculatus TaxID=147232 RepID=UPI003D9EA85F
MFKNNYQGGAAVEIFSGQGKDPVAKWKLKGGPSAIHKEYDKEVKGFVYCLEGSSQTVKMQIPENGKMSLGLLQRFLVLQVNIPQVKDFSTELVITDSQHLKRRLHLSTVHKELSATLLHAKIPLVGLKRNMWSTLCIDLVSFSNELFKGFLSLDGITLFATCKVRRILTIKPDPSEISADDMFLSGAGVTDLIPRSCHFPPGVSHVMQVLNMQSLQRADVRAGLLNSDCALEKSPITKAPSTQRTRPRAVSHAAASSRVSGSPSRSGRESSTKLVGMEKHGPLSSRMNQKVAAESQRTSNLCAPMSHGPPEDECSCSPDRESSESASTPAKSASCLHHPALSADLRVCSSCESNEGSEPEFTLQEVFTFLSQPHSPKRGQGQGNQEKVGTDDGQGQSGSRGRYGAKPEDDFIGSESDEDTTYTTFLHQRSCAESSPSTPRSPAPSSEVQIEVHPESQIRNQTQKEISPPAASTQLALGGRPEPAGIIPVWCLSPGTVPSKQEQKCHLRGSEVLSQVLGDNSSVSRVSLSPRQEPKVEDHTQLQERKDDTPYSVDSSNHTLNQLSSLEDDDEELRMLASLKREQEEDECRASGLSASQIHQCNVSISISTDDTSTWTHISTPTNQGHHYQKEMSPLQSNPREWMDLLSPPIMPPSQQRRSDSTRNNLGNLIAGEEESLNEENEEEFLNLLYDPFLNCYFDPKTGKYYELA